MRLSIGRPAVVMGQDLIISISGMRGIVGENLFAETAARYGAVFGTFLRRSGRSGPVCLGRDSRPSGPMLAAAVTAGLCSVGCEVIDLGIVTTPTVGILTRHHQAAGGVVITASHNPIAYNGIKLLLDNGIAPPKPQAEQIREMFRDGRIDAVVSVDCGTTSHGDDPDGVHIEKVLAIVDRDRIAQAGFRVVLDSVNGAGGRPGVRLLRALGCEVVEVNTEPTGRFAHAPEPTAENLTDLGHHVVEARADVGFAQDPDADRLAVIDADGRYIGEEYTLAMATRVVLGQQVGPVAANLSTSRMIDDVAAAAGARVIRTPVGEANVAQAMIENDCVIGGEGNGGVIDLRVGPVRDSLVAMALILHGMATEGRSIAAMAQAIGHYHMTKTKFAADAEHAARILDRARQAFADARVDTSDGCRFDLPDGWVHLRTSNTEPVMRAIVETADATCTKRYLQMIDQIRSEVS